MQQVSKINNLLKINKTKNKNNVNKK